MLTGGDKPSVRSGANARNWTGFLGILITN